MTWRRLNDDLADSRGLRGRDLALLGWLLASGLVLQAWVSTWGAAFGAYGFKLDEPTATLIQLADGSRPIVGPIAIGLAAALCLLPRLVRAPARDVTAIQLRTALLPVPLAGIAAGLIGLPFTTLCERLCDGPPCPPDHRHGLIALMRGLALLILPGALSAMALTADLGRHWHHLMLRIARRPATKARLEVCHALVLGAPLSLLLGVLAAWLAPDVALPQVRVEASTATALTLAALGPGAALFVRLRTARERT